MLNPAAYRCPTCEDVLPAPVTLPLTLFYSNATEGSRPVCPSCHASAVEHGKRHADDPEPGDLLELQIDLYGPVSFDDYQTAVARVFNSADYMATGTRLDRFGNVSTTARYCDDEEEPGCPECIRSNGPHYTGPCVH